jgi:hypothetical protein
VSTRSDEEGHELGSEQFAEPEQSSDWPDTEGYRSGSQAPLHPPIGEAVRAPLEYSYTAPELMAALPRSEAIDVDALPADLQHKARIHGDDLDNIIESDQLVRRRGGLTRIADSRVGRAVYPLAAYGAVLTAIIAIALMAVHSLRAPEASSGEILAASERFRDLAAVLGVVTLALWFTRRHASEPPWVYTAEELATLDAASIAWPAVPEDLDRYANGETLRREWHNIWMARIQPGAAALVWREPHLVAIATLLGRDIRSSPTWQSELLDVHRVRIDLDRTLGDIHLRAHRVWRARANLVAPPSADPEDVVARRNAEIDDAAGEAWNTLLALVRQLQDYRKALAPIDVIFAEILALQQSSMRITDDAVRQLHIDAAGNTLHAGAVGAAAGELADLNANLTARLATLRQSLTAATNGLALRAP